MKAWYGIRYVTMETLPMVHAMTPRRLRAIYVDWPVFFVTFNVQPRRPVLATHEVHRAFVQYCERGLQLGFAVGRYVIMPDHVHLFAANASNTSLGLAIRGVKRAMQSALVAVHPSLPSRSPWQRGFFDHLLRGNESYAAKWEYVRDNPVRAGLVENAEVWPFQGEICVIDRP